MGKNKFIDFLDSSWHFPDFWFFDPLKFPLRLPPLGWGGQFFLGRNHPQICRDLCILNPFSDLFFAFKVTISRHFAGYASVALETIWLHEPRDLIFLGPPAGPPMTLLCLSRYSSCYPSLDRRCLITVFHQCIEGKPNWVVHSTSRSAYDYRYSTFWEPIGPRVTTHRDWIVYTYRMEGEGIGLLEVGRAYTWGGREEPPKEDSWTGWRMI